MTTLSTEFSAWLGDYAGISYEIAYKSSRTDKYYKIIIRKTWRIGLFMGDDEYSLYLGFITLCFLKTIHGKKYYGDE